MKSLGFFYLFAIIFSGAMACESLAQSFDFGPARRYATAIGPVYVAIADFNEDGNPDLATANRSGSVSVFLGNGDGTFQSATDYSVGSGHQALVIAVADFNHDDKLDMAVTTISKDVVILLGNGDGTFNAPISLSVGTETVAVAAGDLNGDGNVDLVVADASPPQVAILLGNDDGSFTILPPMHFPLGASPAGLIISDFNLDGKLDVAFRNCCSTVGVVTVLLGNGDGTFQASKNYGHGAVYADFAAADVNRDGVPDIVVVDDDAFGPNENITVLLGNGDGTLRRGQRLLSAPVAPLAIALADFNLDGSLDVAISNVNGVSLLSGVGDGTFHAAGRFPTGFGAGYLKAADLNGDGKPDLAFSDYAQDVVKVLINTGAQ